jgi:hypothetical protein
MGAVIFFVVIVAGLLACTPRGERGLALASMAVVGVVIWLCVRINLHSILGNILGDTLAFGYEHRDDLVLVFGAAIILIVPILMIYTVACDQLEKQAAARRIRKRRSRCGLGFVLRSEHPWVWIIEDEKPSGAVLRFRKGN